MQISLEYLFCVQDTHSLLLERANDFPLFSLKLAIINQNNFPSFNDYLRRPSYGWSRLVLPSRYAGILSYFNELLQFEEYQIWVFG